MQTEKFDDGKNRRGRREGNNREREHRPILENNDHMST